MISPTKSDQFLIEEPQDAMRIGFTQAVLQPRIRKCCLVLRIGHFVAPSELGEFLAAPSANGLDQIFVSVAREIQERRLLPVFFSHEQQRNKWREQSHPGGQLLRLEIDERTQAFAARPVAYLIVILAAHHKMRGRNSGRRISMPSAAKPGILP